MIITGATSWTLMGLWQPTDFIVWNFIYDSHLSNTISFSLFLCFIFAQLYVLTNFDILEFFGFGQLLFGTTQEPVGQTRFSTSGLFSVIRHPLHLLTILNLFITPFMTLDRFLFALGNTAYLLWAIPIEEAKLEKKFGPSYQQYKQNVPALVPFIRSQ